MMNIGRDESTQYGSPTQAVRGRTADASNSCELESTVRSYSRLFPAVISHAKGSTLRSEDGREFVDFLSGAGTLNYGHNPGPIKESLLAYLSDDRIVHALDMTTIARREFVQSFDDLVLRPRNLRYKFQFPGPTGTNAVEASLKIARLATGRVNVIAFTNSYHGVTLGSLAATGNQHFRSAAGIPLQGITFLPFDGYLGSALDTSIYLEKVLGDTSSGVDKPAAIIIETIQGEGGINVASLDWLRKVSDICVKYDALLIVDDIQMGCGRTGHFFSFEAAEITPDIVLMSKSLSGYGLPLSLVLIRPEYDVWRPGEHTGTFRGNNLALTTALAALTCYWKDDSLVKEVARRSTYMRARCEQLAKARGGRMHVRGRGMAFGLEFESESEAARIAARAFDLGLIVERCGSRDQVVKLIPPLTIEDNQLHRGLDILEQASAL